MVYIFLFLYFFLSWSCILISGWFFVWCIGVQITHKYQINMIPSLKVLIGPQPALDQELGISQLQNILNRSVNRWFMRVTHVCSQCHAVCFVYYFFLRIINLLTSHQNPRAIAGGDLQLQSRQTTGALSGWPTLGWPTFPWPSPQAGTTHTHTHKAKTKKKKKKEFNWFFVFWFTHLQPPAISICVV